MGNNSSERKPQAIVFGHGIMSEFRPIILRLRRDKNVRQVRVMRKHRLGQKPRRSRRSSEDLRTVEFLNQDDQNPSHEPVLHLVLKVPGLYQRITITLAANGRAMEKSLAELKKFETV